MSLFLALARHACGCVCCACFSCASTVVWAVVLLSLYLIWAVHWCDVLIVHTHTHIYIYSNEYITFYSIFKVCKTKQNYSENNRDKYINCDAKCVLKQDSWIMCSVCAFSVFLFYVQYSVTLFAFKFVCFWFLEKSTTTKQAASGVCVCI